MQIFSKFISILNAQWKNTGCIIILCVYISDVCFFYCQKFGVSKLHDPLETSPLTFSSVVGAGSLPTSLGHAHGHGSPTGPTGTGSSSPTEHVVTKEERHSEKQEAPQNTQYLSSNCVLVTYFSGDTAAKVDEHFTRALSQGTKSSNGKGM